MSVFNSNKISGFNYYSVPVNIRQTAATAANATVFALRNDPSATKEMFIERIFLNMTFDEATPLLRSLQRYSLGGFGGATPSSGTSINVTNLDSSNPATSVIDARFLDTGLTTTGVSFASASFILSCPATSGANVSYIRENVATTLAPGEGIYIRLTVAAVVGQGLCGEIIWSERNI